LHAREDNSFPRVLLVSLSLGQQSTAVGARFFSPVMCCKRLLLGGITSLVGPFSVSGCYPRKMPLQEHEEDETSMGLMK